MIKHNNVIGGSCYIPHEWQKKNVHQCQGHSKRMAWYNACLLYSLNNAYSIITGLYTKVYSSSQETTSIIDSPGQSPVTSNMSGAGSSDSGLDLSGKLIIKVCPEKNTRELFMDKETFMKWFSKMLAISSWYISLFSCTH